VVKIKYVILLASDEERQIWMGYNTFGNLGTTDFNYAFRYDSRMSAELALKKARRTKKWADATIIQTAEDEQAKVLK
jgi:hypothetical protein